MKLKRTLAFLAALIMTAAAFASCSNTTSTDTNQTDGANDTTSSDTTAAVETSDPNEDELGEYDFNGEEHHFYSRSMPSFRGELNISEVTGDQLNDSIYQRNRLLEERYNFVLAETSNEGTTDPARTAVLAGDNTYDVITTRCVYAYNYAAEGIVIPVQDVDEIDLTKNYWNDYLTNAMTVLGKTYFAAGDFNLTGYDFTHILLFNKAMAEDHNLGNLYETVNNGSWTLDKYVEYGTTVTTDLNGDGSMDNSDRFGYLATHKQILPNFWISSGINSVTKDNDDKPVFNLSGNEFFFTLVDELFETHYDGGIWLKNDVETDVHTDFLNMFAAEQALFADCTFFYVNGLRSMETDFGIIPYPKYDESQESYLSRIEGCDLFCIPVTNKNTEFTGVVLESMACESRKSVIPTYYDISLQTKITRDEESAEMLDIIFATRTFDWGDTIWCVEIRDGALYDMFQKNDRNLSSKLATIEPLVEAKIAETVDTFGKLK